MTAHQVVSQAEWLAARRDLLAREKEFTHRRDELNAARLALPWVKIGKDYVFDTETGKKRLSDFFAGRSQLMIYHFMLGPDWKAGCPSCSFVADHLGGALVHLNNHDVSLMAVSRAPIQQIAAYRQRMGWTFPWASSFHNDFNQDFHVSFTPDELAGDKVFYNFSEMDAKNAISELPGLSSFYRDGNGDIFHTYSTYTRGLEELVGTLMLLDRAPKGRNEKSTMDFVRRHDEYEAAPQTHSCCA